MSQLQKEIYSDTSTTSNNLFLENLTTLADTTGARVITDGLEVSAQRMGSFVQLHLKPSASLATSTNASATATIIAVAGLSELFRPLSTVRVLVTVNANGVAVGEVTILANGNIVYSVLGGGNFTTGQPAAILGDVCISYNRRLATF